MKKITILNKLKFKEEKEQALSEYYINKFAEQFIDIELFGKVEITKNCIYLFKHNETGFSHFTIQGLQPKTNREMLLYLQGALNDN